MRIAILEESLQELPIMSSLPPVININPPLVNSSNPWATSLEDLRALYSCSSTGAVTTRTSLIHGFAHDPEKHYYVFLDPASHQTSRESDPKQTGLAYNASLNSLGYSPIPLETYLGFIKTICAEQPATPTKGFLVSVTGSPSEVAESYILVARTQKDVTVPLAVEINLSCPNIPNSPPPAYSGESLYTYLTALKDMIAASPDLPRVPFGLKTPPYTHSTEYHVLIDALVRSAAGSPGGVCPVSFITATNTLGSCLAFSSDDSAPGTFALPGPGTGGMAGVPLHPLALGNVATIRRTLDEHPVELGHIRIVGIGGVLDSAGYARMKAVGAAVVGVGTGLGLKGLDVFKEIENGIGGEW
jgi:dihydroorotate dehydrogenase (fumarate)